MKAKHPLSYGGERRRWCRYLKSTVPRAVSAQQAGSGRLRARYSDTIPSKLKTNPGGKS